MKHTKKIFIKVIALCLVLSLGVPAAAYVPQEETVMPLGSDYLGSYEVFIDAMGNGRIDVWFDVTGVETLDEIGVLSLKLFESTDGKTWTRIETYLHEDNPNMLVYNDAFMMSCITYQGVAGRYYKAFVCIWGGKNGLGDNRYVWSNPVQAT